MLQTAPITSGLRSEVVGPESMAAFAPAWRELCERALEDNVYYTPRYLRAQLANGIEGDGVRFALVWEDDDLIALLPFTAPGLSLPLHGAAARGWQSKYTFGCAPLLERSRWAEAADMLLDLLATVHRGEWVIPWIATQGPAAQAMIGALQGQGRPWLFANHFERATLESGQDFDAVLAAHLSAKRRRDLARNRRRLEDRGAVTFETHDSGPGLVDAVSAFLHIEASGWKGERGTALACAPDTVGFARAVFSGEGWPVCRADVLKVAGVPVAVSLILVTGRTGFTVKCAYDETYKTFAVGLLLEIESMRRFLTRPFAERLDAGTDGAHVIDQLWPDRAEMADLIFSCAARGAAQRLAAFRQTEALRQSARRMAKSLLERIGGR